MDTLTYTCVCLLSSWVPAVRDRSDPIRVVLPFKNQAWADVLRAKNLSQKINTTVQLEFGSQKIEQYLKLREAKPPAVKPWWSVPILQIWMWPVRCRLYMLVSHVAICTNVSKNIKTLLHQLANIFATNILWLQKILQSILVF